MPAPGFTVEQASRAIDALEQIAIELEQLREAIQMPAEGAEPTNAIQAGAVALEQLAELIETAFAAVSAAAPSVVAGLQQGRV